MKKVDVKALGKAMIVTGGLFMLTFVVAIMKKWFGDGVFFAFGMVYLIVLFYWIFKD